MVKRKTTEQFIVDAWCVHGDKYNYSLVDYTKSNQKVTIICPDHGPFEQTPNNHLNGQCCKYCASRIRSRSKLSSKKDFIDKAIKTHNNKFDYSQVLYVNSRTKVTIICPDHGPFEQTPSGHIRGKGCLKCAIAKRSDDRGYRRCTTNQFIKKAKSIHGDKYDYSLVEYTKSNQKVTIICPDHGPFEQIAGNHIHNGYGCPECISSFCVSKGEQELQEWLGQYVDIKTNDRSIIPPLEIDVVILSHKIAIEYNGLYWHGERQGKHSFYHLNKYLQCKDAGYRLIQIWENEWIYKKEIVKNIILNAIGKTHNKIGARQCTIKSVDPKTARSFYNNNHIQGFKGGMHHGLYFKDELVSLLTIDAKGELQRFVNKKYLRVYGAFSRLLKSFDHKEIFTFADLRYFTGNVYEKNGFEYVYTTKPNYYYFKEMMMYHRRRFQKKNIEYIFNNGELTNFDPNLTEYENMLINGYDRIWDCGNMKYMYRR